MSKVTIIQRVWRYLQDHPNENIFVTDVAQAVDASIQQVYPAFTKMRRAGEEVVRPVKGVVRYIPKQTSTTKPEQKGEPTSGDMIPVSEVFAAGRQKPQVQDAVVPVQSAVQTLVETTLVVVGNASDGALIVRDGGGNLYRAKPL